MNRPTPAEIDDLVSWVVRVTDPARRKYARSFLLSHAPTIDVGNTLNETEFDRQEDPERRQEEAAQLIADFIQDARGWSATLSRTQRFFLAAYTSTDKKSPPFVTKPFVVDPDPSLASKEDPADAFATLQRQNADLLRTVSTASREVLELLIEANTRLQKRCAKLEDRISAMVDAREALLDSQAERDLRVANGQWTLAMKQQGGAFLFAQIQKFVESRSNTIDAAKFKACLDALNDEQREVLRPVFGILLDVLPDTTRAELRQLATKSLPANGAPVSTGGGS